MFYPIKISKINRETPSAVSILFAIEEDLKEKFLFKPGQFITVKKDIKGEDVRRSYSICSTPRSGELKVAVKKIEGGLFSTFAVDQLKEGDVIELAVPGGKFTVSCKGNNAKNYVFIAAGSGITPVMSMIKSILTEEPLSKVTLIYGNKSTKETIFYDELLALKNTYSGSFRLQFYFSQETGVDVNNVGRINFEKVKSTVQSFTTLSDIDGVYLCGPQAMIMDVAENLKLAEPSLTEKIHYELFTSTAAVNVASEETDFTEAKVTASIDGVDYTFLVKPGKYILASALAAGIDIPYSCQGGVCGSCECTVTEGKVDLQQNMVLSDDEVEEGQTLACQSTPKTAEIRLDFDF